jgi:subfamily B ATP-binding cassette protein HlyB/CyaB
MRGHSVLLGRKKLFKMGTALPAILILRNGSAMVLSSARPGRENQPSIFTLIDPSIGEDSSLTFDGARLAAVWDGETVLIKKDYPLRDQDRPFGIAWVLGQLLSDRKTTRNLVICALTLKYVGAWPGCLLADHDRPGHELWHHQYLFDVVHRVRGIDGV